MDRLTPLQRRKCMQHNRSRDTKPERRLRRALWGCGVRYRKNVTRLPGCPDLCIRKYKIVIFVDGDFWHGLNWESKRDRFVTNSDFWISKIERNRERDLQITAFYQAHGWEVLRFWESDIMKHLGRCVSSVLAYIESCQSGNKAGYLPPEETEPISVAAEVPPSYG